MDPAAITLLAGVITCVIGICSFVMGRMDNARKSGSMETKIEQALEGINRIDRKLEETSKTQNATISVIKAHEEQIKTLFSRFDELRNRCETSDSVQNAIHELINYLKTKEGIM